MPDFLTKVIKLEILKPQKWAGGDRNDQPCEWRELAATLRTVQYFCARIANQFISERYVQSQLERMPSSPDYEARKLAAINKSLREALIAEKKYTEDELKRYSTNGCVASVVLDALKTSIIDPQISGSNWREVLAANSSVPSYKRRIPLCIRCDKPAHRKMSLQTGSTPSLSASRWVARFASCSKPSG